MQVRMKCSCGREFAADVFSAGELVQCPDCGKALQADCPAAGASAGAGPAARQLPDPMPGQPWPAQPFQPAQPAEAADSPGQPAPPAVPSAPPAPMAPPVLMPPSAPMAPPVLMPPSAPMAPPVLMPPPLPTAPPVYRGAVVVGPSAPIGLAVASMICGALSLSGCVTCFGPFAVVGLAFGTAGAAMGVVSLAKKRGGRGLAISGVITGSLGIVLSLATVSFFAVGLWGGGTFATTPPPTYSAAAVANTATAPSGSPPVWQFIGGGEAAAAGQAPAVMSGQEVVDALTGPLHLSPDAVQAQRALDAALRMYPIREQGQPKLGDEERMLYECVQSFRRHLALAGLAKPADAEHARMFRTACDELVDRVLEAYRQAGQFEQDGKWGQARKSYGDMMKHLPDVGNPVARNAFSHVAWCQRKQAEAKDPGTQPSAEDEF